MSAQRSDDAPPPPKLDAPGGSPELTQNARGEAPTEPLSAIDADELRPGNRIGRYVILHRLGTGGMGVVYAARDPELNRKVAIKLVRDIQTDNRRPSQGRARMLREAQAMAKLSHPNVITVHDLGVFDEQLFVAMELFDGGTLRDWLQQKPRDWREILQVFILAGRGLAAAHDAGLIHRDFKPDNVLMGSDGRVCVTDFGLARSAKDVRADEVDEQNESSASEAKDAANLDSNAFSEPLTRVGAIVGTPRYLSPEQYAGAATDPRSDQFSYCVALFEALYGMLPFIGLSLADRMENAQQGTVQRLPADIDSTVPQWIRKTLERGLAANPAQRFLRMHDLLRVLSQWQTRTMRRVLSAAAIGVGVLIIGGLAFLIGRPYYLCRGADRQLAGVWDAPRKTRLLATLRNQHQAAGIISALDSYLGSFTGIYRTACLASQREPRFRATLDCLSQRRADVDALVTTLGSADDAVLTHAAEAPYRLPMVQACRGAAALPPAAQPPVPNDPARRKRLENARQGLATVRAFAALGACGPAISEAKEVVQTASELGDKPLEAEAKYWLGIQQSHCADLVNAQKTLQAAASAAEVGHDLRLHALALTWQVALRGWQPHAVDADRQAELLQIIEEAQRAQPALQAIAEIKADDPEWHKSQCVLDGILFHRGPQALASCQEALRVYQETLGSGHVETAFLQAEVAAAFSKKEQERDLALPLFGPALDVQKRHLGPRDLYVLRTMTTWARMLCAEHRGEQAVPLFAEVVKRSKENGLDRKPLAALMGDLGFLLAQSNQPEAAGQYYVELIELLWEDPKKHAEVLGQHMPWLLRFYENQGNYEEAQKLAERLLAERINHWGTCGPMPGEAHYLLGRVENERGQYQAGLLQHRQALAALDLPNPEYGAYRAMTGIGVSLLGLGRAAEALPFLERAVRIGPQTPGHRQSLLADANFTLARALWQLDAAQPGRNRDRVSALLQAARSEYVQSGRISLRKLAELDAWVAAAHLDAELRKGLAEPSKP